MIVRWNLTRTLRKYKNADAMVLSIGKSGRTWLKVLLNKYFSLQYNIPFDLDDLSKNNKKIPSIVYTHEIWMHYTDATLDQRVRGKYVIPKRILFNKKIILLYRDPRDIAVSLFFQKTKRSKNKIECNISYFIRHKRYGIYNIVYVMNKLHQRLKNHRICLWLSYENMKTDTFGSLIKVLEFIGIENVNNTIAREAVAFADFENLKCMEASGEFKKDILRPANPSDPDSFKIREGKVGGYVRYFSERDLRYINKAMYLLEDFYRYKPHN